MGKTTLLLNLVGRELKKPRKQRKRIALIPLSQPDAIDQIESIESKRDTILLLDAFDEDARAIEDAPTRMETIMTSAAAFRAVVMTCRTQFFPSDDAIPRETGIKRVAGRRAGIPTVYPWRTVYIQPFNKKQIADFIKQAIPWRRRAQRKKAGRITEEISDLAARPMLTALIPELSASKSEAHGLWDLYMFMVDRWVLRESSWIEPAALMRISKAVAVDLVLGRSARSTERISVGELLALLQLSDETVEGWKLTSRSLLNRDADGFYKFAHRSIMEYFFIQALVDGDNRCLRVKWTDMMCQLFLSWGDSTTQNLTRALEILNVDLRVTSLFPLAERHEASVTLEPSWVKSVLSDKSVSGAQAKLPSAWRAAVSRVVNRGYLGRVYDFAEGLVWQLPLTTSIQEREERAVFKVNRYSLWRRDEYGNDGWAATDLYQLRLLADIMYVKGDSQDFFDERELYWLVDTDGVSSAVARVRRGTTEGPLGFPNLELVHSVSGGAYAIDVYKAYTRGRSVDTLTAIPIFTLHGDAEAIWHGDTQAGRNPTWSLELNPQIHR
jgi:hypothetical protein